VGRGERGEENNIKKLYCNLKNVIISSLIFCKKNDEVASH